LKKKIVIGTIFATFILLSITWLTPAYVKAYELQTKQEIIDKINEIGERLGADDDFKLLIQLHENQEMENIFKQAINTESDAEIKALAQQYLDIIDKDQLKSVLLQLEGKYGEDVEALKTSINNLDKNKGYNLAGNYYKVEQYENRLKIIKKNNEEHEENSILIRGSDCALKLTKDGEWFTQEDHDKLKSLTSEIWSLMGMSIMGIGTFIVAIGEYLIGLGSIDIGSKVNLFGWTVFFFGFLVCYGDVWLEPILECFSGLSKSVNSKPKILIYLENLRVKILNFIQSFLQKTSIQTSYV
jgi:hypothetical protein